LQSVKLELERVLRADQHIRELFMAMVDHELSVEEPYSIEIRAAMSIEDYTDQDKRQQAQQVVDRFGALLDECVGIEVLDSALVSEADLTLADINKLKRWDYDLISLREEANGPDRG
jgi:hypothetical protein